MNLNELTDDERPIFFGLLATMIDADGKTTEGELQEIDALAEEMGIELHEALAGARAAGLSREAVLDNARKITRVGARQIILTVLHDLSQHDGDQGPDEALLLGELQILWS